MLDVAFLLFLSVAGLVASDPEYETEDQLLGVVAGACAVFLAACDEVLPIATVAE